MHALIASPGLCFAVKLLTYVCQIQVSLSTEICVSQTKTARQFPQISKFLHLECEIAQPPLKLMFTASCVIFNKESTVGIED